MLTKTAIQDLTNNELTERMEGLLKNVYCQGSDFVIWERAIPFFKEAAEECTRRGIPHQSHLPEYTRPNDAPPIIHTSALIRYGKRNHLEQLMRGVVSFGASEQYEADVVAARQDYEDRCIIRIPDGPLIIDGTEYMARNQKISRACTEPLRC